MSKKIETVKKSKYFSKKDFALAKKAVSEMKQAKWPNALKTAKKARDKSIYNFVQWRHLLTKVIKLLIMNMGHLWIQMKIIQELEELVFSRT